MAKRRDWGSDLKGTDIEFLHKDGDHIYCIKDGFTFRCHRAHWPPKRLSPEACLTPNEFYKFQVVEVHGDRYILDKVVYTGADYKVTATCRLHGDFDICAKYLKTGQGCVRCSYISSGKKNTVSQDYFINRAKEVHQDKYDYSLVKYVNSSTQVSIICKIHGIFSQIPYNHLEGKGCRLCGWENSKLSRVLSQEDVIGRFLEVHKDRYDYSEVQYMGDAHSLLDIICRDHGMFHQSYANHYHGGQGCPECAKDFNARLRSGFVKSSNAKGGYASLYLIRCFNSEESFYKIGLTTKSVKSRFSGKEAMPYDFEVENLLLGDAEWLWDFEKLLHLEYKDSKYLPKIKFGGMYECFDKINLDNYRKLLDTVA